MKNKALFDKTISILVKAYNDGTLSHRDSCGCAIGNIVAGNLGIKMKGSHSWEGIFNQPLWQKVHCYGKFNPLPATGVKKWYYKRGLKQLKATGYSLEETCAIEKCFENAYNIWCSQYDRDGYIGLMAVIDVLMVIHQVDQNSIKETKELFIHA